MTRRIRAALAAATLMVGFGSTAAVAAAGSEGPERRQVAGMGVMDDDAGMARMHALMTNGGPGTAEMKQLMLNEHQGMARMHAEMMPGVVMSDAHRPMMGGGPK